MYTGAQIFELMNSNCSTTETLDQAQVASHRLEVAHTELADALMAAEGRVNTFWSGAGADSASNGFKPLIDASHRGAEGMHEARLSMYDQNEVFHRVRGNLRPLPQQRPGCDGLTDVLSIGASDAEIAAAKWDDDNRHNIQQYDTYSTTTDSNRTRLVKHYDPVQPEFEGAPLETSQPESIGSIGDRTGTAPSGYSGGIPGPSNGPGGYTAPAGYTPPPASPPASPPAPSSTPPPATQQPPAANWRPPNQSTTPSFATPPAKAVNPDGSYRTLGGLPSRGPGGFGPTGRPDGGSGPVGGGFGPRGGAGFGPVGSGGAPGTPGSNAPPGGGRSTGSAPQGPSGQPAPRPGSTPTGSGSTSGSARGAMPMGGAGKGQGGEDETHERKFILPDDDPDDLFGGTPDGVKVVPPVIGDK